MKKILSSLLILASCVFASCDTENDPPFNTGIGYIGTLGMVSATDPAKTYSFSDVSMELKSAEDNTVTVWIYDMQFPGMPMAIDMTFPGIGFSQSDGVATLQAAELTPYYGPRPMEERKVTGLEGTATQSRLSLRFDCMGYHVTYTGTKQN